MKRFFEKLYTDSKAAFFELLKTNLTENKRMFVVTANPEAFTNGEKNPEFQKLMLDPKTTVVADGIGIVKGAKIIGLEIKERIPGVDITAELFKVGNELGKSVYLFGAKTEVLEALIKVLNEKYPNLKIAGATNGYVEDRDAVFEDILKAEPDIILVALGIPAQELLIYKHLEKFNKGIFVGVGGSFDVLSGTKKRAPDFFVNNNMEWLYRISTEPRRLKRFYNNNVKFFLKIKK